MSDRSDIVQYVIDTYFGGDVGSAAAASGFSKEQIAGWIQQKSKPQKDSIGRLLHYAIVPEFQVIAEYVPLETTGTEASVRSQLRRILKGHEQASGLYAFYDSMANLVYLGKSDGNLLA